MELDIFNKTFARHKLLLFESIDDNWEDGVDWKPVIKFLNSPVVNKPLAEITNEAVSMKVDSRATEKFWEMYEQLPENTKKVAKTKFQLFLANPYAVELHFKPLKAISNHIWSVNINANFRAIGIKKDVTNGFSIRWLFIGNHSQFDDYWRCARKNFMG